MWRMVIYRLLVAAAVLTVAISALTAAVQAGVVPPPDQWASRGLVTPQFGQVASAGEVPGQPPLQVRLVVLAHPGDEMQVWSQVENNPGSLTVFVYLTQGERSPACRREGYRASFQPQLGEVAPNPWPVITNPEDNSSCQNALVNSAVNFLNAMGHIDRTLPTDLRFISTQTLPPEGAKPSRCFGDQRQGEQNIQCVTDSSVRVFASQPARSDQVATQPGMALFFNLGDRDLDSMEVSWALRSVITQREKLGIPLSYPVTSIVGTYYQMWGYPGCSIWANPDNLAVHRALYRDNFGVTQAQWGATCASDADAALTRVVSGQAWNAALAMGPARKVDGRPAPMRIGAFQRYYGWTDSHPGGFVVISNPGTQMARTSEAHIGIMRRQSFWHTWVGAAQVGAG